MGDDAGTEATRDVLARLVALPTVSSEPNVELLDWVVDEALAGVDVAVRRTPWSADPGRANALVSLGPDARGAEDGGLVLSGHTDVVPVAAQPWTTDPFELVERDGRLHGRGTADMKGFIACAIVAVRAAATAGALRRPVHLALSHSEELGCLGAPDLIADLEDADIRPAAVVVGEPTSCRPVTAHKGVRAFRVSARGLDAHSSAPHLGANAITALARLLARYDDVGAELARQLDEDFDPPFTTTNVGEVGGGTAINIIAREAWATIEYRPVPRHDDDGIVRELQAWADEHVVPRLREADPDGGVEIEPQAVVPSFAPAGGDDVALRLLRDVGVDADTGSVAFATEAGQFQAAGLSAVVCGPGSIDQAHQPDEFVTVDQLQQGQDLLHRLVRTCC